MLTLQNPVQILKKNLRILIPDKFRKSHQISWNLDDLLKSYKAKFRPPPTVWLGLKLLYCTRSQIFSFVVQFAVIRRYSLPLPFLVICCHLLSLVVIRSHLLYHSLSRVVICFTTRCLLLSLVVNRYHSLSLDILVVFLFINDQIFLMPYLE